jgi:hypothetical protein
MVVIKVTEENNLGNGVYNEVDGTIVVSKKDEVI